MNAKDSKLKDRIAKKRAEIKELQEKRAELRASASTSRPAKAKRSPRRSRSQQPSAAA